MEQNTNEVMLIAEIAQLKLELLAKELIIGCLVKRLGDNVVITKEDLRALKFQVGNLETITAQGGMCMNRTPQEEGSVLFSLITQGNTKEKVM